MDELGRRPVFAALPCFGLAVRRAFLGLRPPLRPFTELSPLAEKLRLARLWASCAAQQTLCAKRRCRVIFDGTRPAATPATSATPR